MMLTSDLAVYDHKEGMVTLIANAINWDGSADRVDLAYEKAIERLDKMELELAQNPLSEFREIPARATPNYDRNTTDTDYINKVELIKEEIKSGE